MFGGDAVFASSLSSSRVHIVTWNVGSAVPPDDIASLFGPNVSEGAVDMFVIGYAPTQSSACVRACCLIKRLASVHRLQEVNSMINKRLKDALFSDQWSELCMDALSPSGYVLVSTAWRACVSPAVPPPVRELCLCPALSGGVSAHARGAAAGLL